MSADVLKSLGGGVRISLSANTKQVAGSKPPRICAATGKVCAEVCPSPGPCKNWTFTRG